MLTNLDKYITYCNEFFDCTLFSKHLFSKQLLFYASVTCKIREALILFCCSYFQVDRSAAYAARWVAKSVVAAGLARRCLIQVAYAIGISEPLSINVITYGTGTKSDAEILEIVKKNFDLRPGIIVRYVFVSSRTPKLDPNFLRYVVLFLVPLS